MEIRIQTPPAPIPFLSIAKPGGDKDGEQAQRRVPPTVDVKTDNKARAPIKEDNKPLGVREQNKRDEKPLGVREEPELPTVPRIRLELRIDDDTKRVFGRVVDRESGKEIRQIPAESIRQLQAISRELFGSLIDEKV
jgi:uncharacterized FlaG/YvyC family protein